MTVWRTARRSAAQRQHSSERVALLDQPACHRPRRATAVLLHLLALQLLLGR